MLVLLFLVAAAAAQCLSTNPVLRVSPAINNTGGLLIVHGGIQIDCQVETGTLYTSGHVLRGVLVDSTGQTTSYNVTVDELVRGFIYSGSPGLGAGVRMPSLADFEAYFGAPVPLGLRLPPMQMVNFNPANTLALVNDNPTQVILQQHPSGFLACTSFNLCTFTLHVIDSVASVRVRILMHIEQDSYA